MESEEYSEDYSNTDIQSGLSEARPGEEDDDSLFGLTMLVFNISRASKDANHVGNVDANDAIMITTIMTMMLMMVMMMAGRGEEVTVTHQVPTRTVFTVIERGETKSLFADVLETSLEVGKLI